jgi:hypothetical protein
MENLGGLCWRIMAAGYSKGPKPADLDEKDDIIRFLLILLRLVDSNRSGRDRLAVRRSPPFGSQLGRNGGARRFASLRERALARV